MIHTDAKAADAIGADLRALRKARGMTLADMADRLGRSVGWLSQVERDMSTLTVNDLRQIAQVLEVHVSMLFARPDAPADEIGYVVRKGARRPIGNSIDGLVEELLSPDLTDDFEMVHSTFQPHSKITAAVTRPTQEVAVLLSGTLDLDVSGKLFTIHPGDSFRIRGEPFRWMNPYTDPAVAIWVIAPPVY